MQLTPRPSRLGSQQLVDSPWRVEVRGLSTTPWGSLVTPSRSTRSLTPVDFCSWSRVHSCTMPRRRDVRGYRWRDAEVSMPRQKLDSALVVLLCPWTPSSKVRRPSWSCVVSIVYSVHSPIGLRALASGLPNPCAVPAAPGSSSSPSSVTDSRPRPARNADQHLELESRHKTFPSGQASSKQPFRHPHRYKADNKSLRLQLSNTAWQVTLTWKN